MTSRVQCAALIVLAMVTSLAAQSDAPRTIQIGSLDRGCKACDDMWRFANGTWLDANPIPAAYSSWGPSQMMTVRNRESMRAILESLAGRSPAADSNEGRLAAFYGSCMDTDVIDRLGLQPIRAGLDAVDALRTMADLRAILVRYQSVGRPNLSSNGSVIGFFRFTGGVDPQDPSRVIARLVERDSSGRTPSSILSMPDRDYYVKDDAKTQSIRTEFLRHVETLMQLAGSTTPTEDARTVLAFEMTLARAALPNTDRREPERVYHPMTLSELERLAPNFDWRALLRVARVPASTVINVTEPEIVIAGNRLMSETPLQNWKTWLRWRVVKLAAPYLASAFASEDFRFERTVLAGVSERLPRWQTCVDYVDRDLSDAIGPLWVAKYFPPEAKRRMEVLVENVREAMREEIQESDWMQPETKRAAVRKLNALRIQVGYPPQWRSYAGLRFDRATFYQNVSAAWQHGQRYQWSKIGRPTTYVDWSMTAPTVNAYSNSTEVRLVFPAGYLQPPYFDSAAEDAVNYAGIGTTIGHEMGHQFDDGGSKYDETGRLREWWTAEDRKQFTERAACIIDQFDSVDVGDGLHHNGRLVVGEAMGDLGGLRVAYRAFQRAQRGQPERTIDGYSPDQRFFIAFAQKWSTQFRPEAMRLQLATDNHPLSKYRSNLTLTNMPEFRQAFGCAEGDPMTRPAKTVCRIW